MKDRRHIVVIVNSWVCESALEFDFCDPERGQGNVIEKYLAFLGATRY
jgi:hypothetical protein